MKVLTLTTAQYQLVADILSGALEDLECFADETGDAHDRAAARKVALLRPIVDAITAHDTRDWQEA